MHAIHTNTCIMLTVIIVAVVAKIMVVVVIYIGYIIMWQTPLEALYTNYLTLTTTLIIVINPIS